MRSVGEFGAPLQISTGFASWQRYCTASSSGRQLNFAALNRGRHLCSAGRPSGWALAHILVIIIIIIAQRSNCSLRSQSLLSWLKFAEELIIPCRPLRRQLDDLLGYILYQ